MSEFKKEIEFSKTLARQAGEIMKKYFNNHEVKFKDDNTPVTIADETINQLVLDKIREAFPGDGVFAEEGSDYESQSRMWVVDPIDGTVPYTFGLPLSFFSLGFVVDGQVQFGVCFRPFDDAMYFGNGKVATKNNQAICVNSTSKIGEAVFSACFHNTEEYRNAYKAVSGLAEVARGSISLQCIVADAMLVAEGKIEIATYPHNHPYDIAGLKPIIEGAGGKVTDLNGIDQRYDRDINGAIITNGVLHDQVVNYFKNPT
jgi:fructose-1,6-bisphosphatase/inositol monophosphatase family enzyme